MVCSIHPPPCSLTATPEVNQAQQLSCGSADAQSIPLSKCQWQPGTASGRIQMKALLSLATEAHQIQDLGGLMRTGSAQGSGCSCPPPSAAGTQERWLRPGHRQACFGKRPPQAAPGDSCVFSSNKRVSCPGLETMAALERVCVLLKDGLLL